MKELLEFIVKSLVNNPADVVINESEREGTVYFEVHVNESDMGKIIGKQGRIAKAIRSVMKAASVRENKKVIVDII